MLSTALALRSASKHGGRGVLLTYLSEALSRNTLKFSTGPSKVTEVASDSDFKDILHNLSEGDQVAVVDFTAKWCGPCRQIAPIYEQLALDNPKVKFLKVDIDDERVKGTVVEHGISSVPTFTFYKGTQRAESFSGARPDMLRTLLKQYQSE